MASAPELKPCPFCGGRAEWNIGQKGDGSPWRYITCESCEAIGPAAPEIETVAAWNRRAPELAVSEASERAHALVADLERRGLKTIGDIIKAEQSGALSPSEGVGQDGIDTFKPCVTVNDESGITEAIFEDVSAVAVPVFDGVYHYIDKLVAPDDGRLVGLQVWATKSLPAKPAERE